MKSRVRARSMTSRSTLVGQSHSKSAMGLNFLMADSRSRRSRLRRERSWVSSWASCSSSMRGDQRALVARARKSSRFAGMVFRPMCLSCASRSFIGIGLMVLVGELIVGLQIVRDDIERLQFWVATEIHRGGSGVLLRALPSAQDERHRRSTWCVALDGFPDGRTQLGGPVSIQELEELCGLAARRFSTCESGIEQSLAFRHRLRQATTWGGSEGLALFLQQGLLVSGIEHELVSIIGAAMLGDLLTTVQDPHPRVGGHQGQWTSDGLRRDGVVVQVETKVNGLTRVDRENQIGLERVCR